ncbi:uncharacterized protein LOC122541481 [Chiloscyllium plagiosum]|uniref:uncharacterized protein LOC122541481 n=1 Tax=Chiloscyllium plagiosum TaxID=36176 RepID=UPI001CB8064F|nr:uncharacterized protein LOC122541481 [Chiloscyllium plagiosum]
MGGKGSCLYKDRSTDNVKLEEIPSDSPLGKMLGNWEHNSRTRGKDKVIMIRYCCFVWTQESIKKSDIFWPKYGSDEDWLCQDLNIYVNSKEKQSRQEADYVVCWIGSQNMFVLKKKETEEKDEKPKTPSWDPLSNLPPPYYNRNDGPPSPSDSRPSPQPSAPPAEETPEEESEKGPEEDSTVSQVKTRSAVRKEEREQGGATQVYAFREVSIGNGEIGYVNAPLTSGEVRAFKKEMKNLIEDPVGLGEQLYQILGPNWYTWGEMMAILGTLFSGEERGMVRRAALREWEKRYPPGEEVTLAEQNSLIQIPDGRA